MKKVLMSCLFSKPILVSCFLKHDIYRNAEVERSQIKMKILDGVTGGAFVIIKSPPLLPSSDVVVACAPPPSLGSLLPSEHQISC